LRATRFRWPALVALCVAIAVPALALAADPKPGGHYTGKSKPLLGTKRHSVSIRISSSGERGTIRYCGDRRRKATSAGFRVRNGRFKATKRITRSGKRVVSFQATGRFTSRTKVTGDIVVVFKCDGFPGSYTARLRN
jgi:hypothetical protein